MLAAQLPRVEGNGATAFPWLQQSLDEGVTVGSEGPNPEATSPHLKAQAFNSDEERLGGRQEDFRAIVSQGQGGCGSRRDGRTCIMLVQGQSRRWGWTQSPHGKPTNKLTKPQTNQPANQKTSFGFVISCH